MIDRINELLAGCTILPHADELTPIQGGASGAHMLSVNGKYAVKYTNLSELDINAQRSLTKEYEFYKLCGNKYDFIPEVVYQNSDENGLLIVFVKYSPVENSEWTGEMQKRAMEMCARIHAIRTNGFDNLFLKHSAKQWDDNTHTLDVSLESWSRLHVKFPDEIDVKLLNEMYKNFDEIALSAEKIPVPETLKHGDFHPWQMLRSKDRLLICDWQNTDIGCGVDDLTFFISRGETALEINRDMLIASYARYLSEHANININANDIRNRIAASEFNVSFRFWADYLQEGSLDAVMGIYNKMVKCYNQMKKCAAH